MANVTTQIMVDNAQKAVVKAVGFFGAANTTNVTLVQANALFGANASKQFCPLILTKLQYSVKTTGNIALEWTSNGNVINGTIQSFGNTGYVSGVIEGIPMFNNANNPFGDITCNIANAGPGDSFNFNMVLEKDSVVSGKGVGAWANSVNGYSTITNSGF